MPIRGKILNCLKADYARIFKSDIIVDLIKVMGCGVELGGKHNKELATFNLDNLRFNKIVICTDADVDGYQIRTLVLTMLYRLTPTLIKEGYVYIAESPLYEITTQRPRPISPTPSRRRPTFLKEIGDEEIHHPALERSGRERPGDDVADHHEPGEPPPDQGDARPMWSRRRAVFDLLLGDNLAGPQGAHCGARRRVSGRSGRA